MLWRTATTRDIMFQVVIEYGVIYSLMTSLLENLWNAALFFIKVMEKVFFCDFVFFIIQSIPLNFRAPVIYEK